VTQQDVPDPLNPSLEPCAHCGARVPAGVFCGSCGAHLTDLDENSRVHNHAASPHEHVARVAVVSTLFPHLPHRHAHVFCESLLAGVLVVVLLGALRLYAPALVLAAALLPVLYLLYVYEVEVYETEPVAVTAATFVAGALIDQDLKAKNLPQIGFANPALYTFAQNPSGLPSPPFHDVTVGTNLFYPATPEWDFATGIGTPDVGALAADFEWYERTTPVPDR
jgi:hypothetical protein